MARIKYVINERRLAYEGAVKIHNDNAKLERMNQARQAEMAAQAAEQAAAAEEARALEEALQAEKEAKRVPSAKDVAVKSIFEAAPTPEVVKR